MPGILEKLRNAAKQMKEAAEADAAANNMTVAQYTKALQEGQSTGDYNPKNDVDPTVDKKALSLSNLADALEAGLIDIDRYSSYLTESGYNEEDVGILTNLAQQALEKGGEDTQLSLGTLLGAWENGTLDEAGLRGRLNEAGFKGEDVDLLLASTLKNEQEQKGVDYSKVGGNVQPGKDRAPMSEIKGNAIFDLMNSGEWTKEQAFNQLVRTGHNESDAWDLIRANQKSQAEAGTDPRGAGSSGGSNSIRSGVRYAGSSGGGGGEKPTAQGLLRDFRTSFAQNMKAQGKGLSAGAKQWAMDNQDIFLDDYIGTLGQGGVAGRGVFTKGAAEINTLYEGSKGARQAAYRAGQGTTQARMI